MPVVAVATETYETVAPWVACVARSGLPANARSRPPSGCSRTTSTTSCCASGSTVTRPTRMTPLMFEHALIERARADRRHIVLPEGEDDRILQAAEQLLLRGVVDLTVLGRPRRDPRSGRGARARLPGVAFRRSGRPRRTGSGSPTVYAELRKHKGVALPLAMDTMADGSYFGTMMIHERLADGMVSGAAHTTAHTIRPAFEIIRTAPGVSLVSSAFLMCLADRVLVYADCAVVPQPRSRAASRHRDVRRRAPPRCSASSRGWRCCPTRRAGRARAATSTRPAGYRVGPRAAAGPAGGRADPVRRRRRPGRGADQAAGQPGGRAGHGVRLPRPQHRQQHVQGGAAQRRVPSPSGPCCKAWPSRSTTCLGGPPSPTSSTRWRSPRSRRRWMALRERSKRGDEARSVHRARPGPRPCAACPPSPAGTRWW